METDPDQMPDGEDPTNPQGEPPPDEGSGDSTPLPAAPESGA